MANRKKTAVPAAEFDRKFEAGEDLSGHLDYDAAIQRVNIDFPVWAVRALDQEATRRGITRQALVKHWIVEKLDGLGRRGTGS
jgi:hypothetical protein